MSLNNLFTLDQTLTCGSSTRPNSDIKRVVRSDKARKSKERRPHEKIFDPHEIFKRFRRYSLLVTPKLVFAAEDNKGDKTKR